MTGDREGALAMLREIDHAVPHAATVWPLADMGRARFMRAELERELGDVSAAERFYVGLDEPWSPWDSYWRPLLYERMGRIAQEAGRNDEAVLHYSRLMELWRDADPSAMAQRDEIAGRLADLAP